MKTPECQIRASRKWRAKNVEHCRAYQRKYYWSHRKQVCEASKEWKQKNHERYLAYMRNYNATMKAKKNAEENCVNDEGEMNTTSK